MKTIKEIQEGYVCPKCQSNKDLRFQAENVRCDNCKGDWDLGVKKYD